MPCKRLFDHLLVSLGYSAILKVLISKQAPYLTGTCLKIINLPCTDRLVELMHVYQKPAVYSAL